MYERGQFELLEVFNSFQGEFPYIGRFSTFIRFPKCNLKCSFCDTLYKDTTPVVKRYTYDDIIPYIAKTNFITFTGGEPSLYKEEMFDIVDYCINKSMYLSTITVETNGIELEKMQDLANSIYTLGIVNVENLLKIIWSPKFYNDNLRNIQMTKLYDQYNPTFQFIKLVSVPEDMDFIDEFVNIAIHLYGTKVKKNIALMLYTDENNNYVKQNIVDSIKLCEKHGISISGRLQFQLNIR